MKEVIINGETFVNSDYIMARECNGLKYVICRSDSAGVFAGYLQRKDGQEAVLVKARRIWKWAGAASLSQLAVDGTSKPEECKFPCAVPKVELNGVIEVLDCTEKSRLSIEGVAVWSA